MAYPYQRSNFWDTLAQQRALGRRLSPGQTQAALTGERAGELQAYYDQSDRNRLRRLQEQQLELQQGSQESLEDYRNRQLETQTDLAQQGLNMQATENAANRGFQTQQAQASDAAARNQAILGYTGLGLGALRYTADAGSGWRYDPNTGKYVPQSSYVGRLYDRVFGPNTQAVNNVPQGNVDYNFPTTNYGDIFGNMDYGQAFTGMGGFELGDAGMDYGGFDWGSLGNVT